ncbi:Ankyrin repeat-containing domain protein [Hyaloscypha variabilis]
MPQRQPRGRNDDCLWDRHKATIRRLYIAENRPLEGPDGVMETMRVLTQNEFDKTPRQYEARFKKWGFRKNQRGEHWAVIGRKMAARKEEGKESIVYFEGKEVPQAKITKRTYCNNYNMTFQHHNQGPIPATPEGFALLTPIAESQEPVLTFNLPFVQFQVALQQMRNSPMLSYGTENHDGLQNSSATSCDVFHASLPREPTAPKTAQEIEAHRVATNTYYTVVLPKMKSLLPSLVVEDYTESGLGTLPPSEMLHEAHIKFLCFSVANNYAGPTTKVLAEKFFTCAIESGDVQAVEYLFQKGYVDANEHVCIVEGTPYTPVALSARLQNIHMTKLLVFYKSDVNKTHSGANYWEQGALQHALIPSATGSRVEPELVRVLLDAGAEVDLETVGNTITWSHAQIAEMIIRKHVHSNRDLWAEAGLFHAVFAYLDIETVRRIFQLGLEINLNINMKLSGSSQQYLVWDPYADGKTLLDIAAQRGETSLVETILGHGAFLTEDTLTCAIQSTNKDLISYILRQGPKVNSLATFGETPYSEAIRTGDMNLVKLLEDKGALDKIEDSPRFKAAVSAASEVGNLGVLKNLIIRVADLNRDVHYELGYALAEAVKAGHEEIALFLINVDANVAIYPRYGVLSLFEALKKNMKRVIRAILDLNIEIYPMAGLLGAATNLGDHSIIKDLIFAGVSINDPDNDDKGPLATAVSRNDMDLVRLLLAEGVDINLHSSDDDGGGYYSPLAFAVTRGNMEMASFLLEEGADPDEVALAEATSQDLSFLQLLLEAFAKRYPRGKKGYGSRAAVKAIEEDNVEMLEVLLNSNADVTVWQPLYSQGKAPLACAIIQNKLVIVQRLISRGLDLNNIIAIGELGYSSPQRPQRAQSPPQPPNAPITRERPTNPDRPYRPSRPTRWLPSPLLQRSTSKQFRRATPPRFTALLVAVHTNNPEMLQMLINAGAKVNLAATRGIRRTPLQMAAELGKMEALQVLINNGAEINAKPADEAGGTALQLAAIGGFIGIAEELLKRSADVNAPPSKRQGRTALEGAVEHGRIDMVRFLVNAGAEIGSPGHRQYERLLRLAKENGHRVILEMLETLPRSEENVRFQSMLPDGEWGSIVS